MIGNAISRELSQNIFKLFKANMRILPLVRDFHKNPSIDVFNEIIRCDPICLEDGALQVKYRNPTFQYMQDKLQNVVYEGEDDLQAWRRRVKAKKQLDESPVSEFNPNFCNPFLLVWVNSAVRAFPQLYACDSPMYIEYSQKFTAASFTNWQQFFNQICDGTGDTAHINSAEKFICCVAMRYCASGDIVPLQDVFTRAKALDDHPFSALIGKLTRLLALPRVG